MADEPYAGTRQLWYIAALYAGLTLNLIVLESVGFSYHLVGNLPRLSLVLLAYGIFLGAAVFYVPARLSSNNGPPLEDILRSCLGGRAAWFSVKIIFPAWIFAWFFYNTAYACRLLEVSIFHRTWFQPSFSRQLFVGLLWLFLIAPAAKAPLPTLARFTVFTTKVSAILILGLALSSRDWIPNGIEEYKAEGWAFAMPLEVNLLLWTAPPLMFAGRLTGSLRLSKRAFLAITAGGIIIPVLFVALSAVLTMAGAEGVIGGWLRKLPSYFRYVYSRPHDIGWVKVLLMTFTLLAATRFAANLGVSVITRRPRLWIAALQTLAVIAATWILDLGSRPLNLYAMIRAWQYTALPFVPLAGVLCAAYLNTRGGEFVFTPAQQKLSILAWLAGCVVTILPTRPDYYSDGSGVRPMWVMFGWAVSLGAAWCGGYLARRLK
jgi:hypothetical protein